jgi:hypothetical protein
MFIRQSLLWGLIVGLGLGGLATPVEAGMVGFPAARLRPLQLRVELAGDSFKEDLQNAGNAEATTGRALVTVALGLTDWAEVFARIGIAEFNVDEALFKGNFGLAYGGGLRLKLWTFPLGVFGVSGQYLRFTSDDDNSVGDKVEGKWEEFDATVGFGTRRFGAFAFYIGGAFHHSDITLDRQGTNTTTTLESEIPFRVVLGAHIFPLVDDPSGKLLINIEARLIGETPQFTLGIQYAF